LVGNIGQVLHPHELRHRAPRLARHLSVGPVHNLLFMHTVLKIHDSFRSKFLSLESKKHGFVHVRTVPKNSKQIFPEMKLCGLVFPSFCSHVTVSDLCNPMICPPILLYCVWAPIVGIYTVNRSQIHECRNWERGRTVSFPGIFGSNFRDSAFAVCTSFL
jgi:hypothetical protein